ncbi:tyrosine-type recombinase/integrase [Denitrobaculum tricleocarpae]|uniref:Site-specific integrase n=1 Tax=Denitrobaculum tricleocarpae TaxID=2591009 RepID=A0A545TT23_9PROT|nr:site-specific integrase [Denitrobaculum tricleocarpae]TQV80366.1 site-specific integrase [Denitrobaculum tricleocarpae]
MTRIPVKHLKVYKDRHGKRRVYCRVSGKAIKSDWGSAEFFREIDEARKPFADAEPSTKPGTLGHLIKLYRAGDHFKSRKPRTKSDYQKVIDHLKSIEDAPLGKIDKPFVAKLRDEAAQMRGRRFGNYVKTVISAMFSWGSEYGYTPATNPLLGIKNIPRPEELPDPNRPWTDAERHIVLDAAPIHLKVPIALGMYTGLRVEDVLMLLRTEYNGIEISRETNKSKQDIWWPCPKDLKAILDEGIAHRAKNPRDIEALTLCINSRGRAWSYHGFQSSFYKFIRMLQGDEEKGIEAKVAPGLTFHGLRHTVGTILAEEGFDASTIADALGHATEEMARHYMRHANLKKKMTGVVKVFDVALNERRPKSV